MKKSINRNALKLYLTGLIVSLLCNIYLLAVFVYYFNIGRSGQGLGALLTFLLGYAGMVYYFFVAAANIVFLVLVIHHRKKRMGNAYPIVLLVLTALGFLWQIIYVFSVFISGSFTFYGVLQIVYLAALAALLAASILQISYNDPDARPAARYYTNYLPPQGQYIPPQYNQTPWQGQNAPQNQTPYPQFPDGSYRSPFEPPQDKER